MSNQKMMHSRRAMGIDPTADGARANPRRPWISPLLRKIYASEAQNGIDPIIPDGPLSFGS